MILYIQTNPNNPILRQKAREVKEITAEIKQLILDMIETMEKAPGVGLAAPQVGQSLRVIVAKTSRDEKSETISLINPKIKKSSWKKALAQESCLNFPQQSYLLIKRPVKIKVEGLNPEGAKVKIKAEGLLARIIQHEVDHLDGVLIVDK